MVIKNKKGQIKIQQMAFMLIAVTVFFVLAGLFMLMIKLSNLRESAELLEEKNALLLASKVADSPEFSCGDSLGKPRANCIDTDKLMALKARIAAGEYIDFWGIDGIEIRKVFPVDSGECTVERYPNCEKITIVNATSGTGKSNFVSLCRKEKNVNDNGLIYNKCELGEIIVIYNENKE